MGPPVRLPRAEAAYGHNYRAERSGYPHRRLAGHRRFPERDRFHPARSAGKYYFAVHLCGQYCVRRSRSHCAFDETPLLARQEADDYRFDAPAASYTLLAPANAKVFANGKALSDDQITAVDALWKSEFSGLSAAPSATEYTLSNLYAPPVFTAAADDISLDVIPDGAGRYTCIFPADEALQAAYATQAVDFVKAYLHYTTQGYRNTQANLDAVLALTRYPSPLYKNLKNSYIGYMYIAPQAMTLEAIEAKILSPTETVRLPVRFPTPQR